MARPRNSGVLPSDWDTYRQTSSRDAPGRPRRPTPVRTAEDGDGVGRPVRIGPGVTIGVHPGPGRGLVDLGADRGRGPGAVGVDGAEGRAVVGGTVDVGMPEGAGVDKWGVSVGTGVAGEGPASRGSATMRTVGRPRMAAAITTSRASAGAAVSSTTERPRAVEPPMPRLPREVLVVEPISTTGVPARIHPWCKYVMLTGAGGHQRHRGRLAQTVLQPVGEQVTAGQLIPVLPHVQPAAHLLSASTAAHFRRRVRRRRTHRTRADRRPRQPCPPRSLANPCR
jgi:hypothetical protein